LVPVDRNGVTESSSNTASPRPTKPEIGGSGGQPVFALSSISTGLGGAGANSSSLQLAVVVRAIETGSASASARRWTEDVRATSLPGLPPRP
jgi:hypothetical protein